MIDSPTRLAEVRAHLSAADRLHRESSAAEMMRVHIRLGTPVAVEVDVNLPAKRSSFIFGSRNDTATRVEHKLDAAMTSALYDALGVLRDKWKAEALEHEAAAIDPTQEPTS